MAYLGMVPSEHTSGPKRRVGAITKAGDVHARTLLIEAAHSYRFPARIARDKLRAVDAVPDAVRAIAWKAQTRLCQRYRSMVAKGKPNPVVVTAIARELAGFVWSIACITSDPPVMKNVATLVYNKVVMPSSVVEPLLEEVTRQAQQVTPDTGRSRAPRRQPLRGTARHAGRPGQTGAVSAERSLTG
jgi:hypothetical protein